jgi:hypothetical protein
MIDLDPQTTAPLVECCKALAERFRTGDSAALAFPRE